MGKSKIFITGSSNLDHDREFCIGSHNGNVNNK